MNEKSIFQGSLPDFSLQLILVLIQTSQLSPTFSLSFRLMLAQTCLGNSQSLIHEWHFHLQGKATHRVWDDVSILWYNNSWVIQAKGAKRIIESSRGMNRSTPNTPPSSYFLGPPFVSPAHDTGTRCCGQLRTSFCVRFIGRFSHQSFNCTPDVVRNVEGHPRHLPHPINLAVPHFHIRLLPC